VKQWKAPKAFSAIESEGMPNQVYPKQAYHDVDNATLYIAGFTRVVPQRGESVSWGVDAVARYDGWVNGEQQEAWQVQLPFDRDRRTSRKSRILSTKALDIAGDYLFAVNTTLPVRIYVFSKQTGAMVDYFDPGPEVTNMTGLVDIHPPLHAFNRNDGSYVITHEDNSTGRQIMYHRKPQPRDKANQQRARGSRN
jgi:hypothetical protein